MSGLGIRPGNDGTRSLFAGCWPTARGQEEKEPCLLYLICVSLLPLPVPNMYRHDQNYIFASVLLECQRIRIARLTGLTTSSSCCIRTLVGGLRSGVIFLRSRDIYAGYAYIINT